MPNLIIGPVFGIGFPLLNTLSVFKLYIKGHFRTRFFKFAIGTIVCQVPPVLPSKKRALKSYPGPIQYEPFTDLGLSLRCGEDAFHDSYPVAVYNAGCIGCGACNRSATFMACAMSGTEQRSFTYNLCTCMTWNIGLTKLSPGGLDLTITSI